MVIEVGREGESVIPFTTPVNSKTRLLGTQSSQGSGVGACVGHTSGEAGEGAGEPGASVFGHKSRDLRYEIFP